MNIFRAIATSAAGVWLGGMVLIAIVAQTTFAVMRTTGVDTPNAVAGQVMARNFARFDTVQMICAAILVIWQIVHMMSGGTQGRDWLRLGLIVVACALMLTSAKVLTPRILNLQEAVAAPDPEAAIQAVFERFHDTAVRVAKINLVVVLAIVLEMALPRPAAETHTPQAKPEARHVESQ